MVERGISHPAPAPHTHTIALWQKDGDQRLRYGTVTVKVMCQPDGAEGCPDSPLFLGVAVRVFLEGM